MTQTFFLSLIKTKPIKVIFWLVLILASLWLAFLFAPERTNDGLIHLFWNSFWVEQIKTGDLFPKWYAQGYGGYGNASFLFYPPLLKYIALPYHLLGFSPLFALRSTVATILMLNLLSASTLAAYLFSKKSLLYYQLILLLAINPYLFYCLFWRGALAECLAIALLSFWGVSLLKISKDITLKNGLIFSTFTFLIIIAHLPTFIIIFFLFNIYSIILFWKERKLSHFVWRIIVLAIGIMLSTPYLVPVFLNLDQIHQPAQFSIKDWVAFSKSMWVNRQNFMITLIFTIYVIIYFLSIPQLLKKHKQMTRFDIVSYTIISGISLLMISPFSLPFYKLFFPLKKIQFPFRFLAVTSSFIFALSLVSASLNFQKWKVRFLVIIPIIASLCIPHYLLLSSVLTQDYQNPLPKQELNRLITQRINHPSYQHQWIEEEPLNSVQTVDIGRKKYNLASGFLLVPDVKDYLPSIVNKNMDFWTFTGNRVSPANNYQDHNIHTGKGQLTLIESSIYRRVWQCKVITDMKVDIGISYFRYWMFETEPKGLIKHKAMSKDGLFTLQLQPGEYKLIGQYNGRLSWLLGLLPLICPPILILLHRKWLRRHFSDQ